MQTVIEDNAAHVLLKLASAKGGVQCAGAPLDMARHSSGLRVERSPREVVGADDGGQPRALQLARHGPQVIDHVEPMLCARCRLPPDHRVD